MEYFWAIGTSPNATDIQDYLSAGTNSFAFNNKLEGILEDNSTYYVTLKAVNEAGLVTTVVSDGKDFMKEKLLKNFNTFCAHQILLSHNYVPASECTKCADYQNLLRYLYYTPM